MNRQPCRYNGNHSEKADHNELLIIGPEANGSVGGVGFLAKSTSPTYWSFEGIYAERLESVIGAYDWRF
ncbi:unnamed protein product [Haemonchus placei]|uniref:Peptidase S1 domain-containing protein n=1 Tax=Haemonchus placei TaxID=6290 RepID=A0A0N4WZA5_HAEPC|nr:unnamed protein product [Haemonchus placei]